MQFQYDLIILVFIKSYCHILPNYSTLLLISPLSLRGVCEVIEVDKDAAYPPVLSRTVRVDSKVKSRMGACASNLTPEEQEANARNREISKQLKKDREKQSVKLLLLGTGNFQLQSHQRRKHKKNLNLSYLDHALYGYTKEAKRD